MSPNSSFNAPSGGKVAAAAAAAAKKAQIHQIAVAQYYDQRIPEYFAIAMGGLIAIFTIFHWTRFWYSRSSSKALRQSSIMQLQVKIARSLRRQLLRGVPGFTSIGHAVLVCVYLGVNIALTVTNVNWSGLTGIGKRCGWMALTNIAFITLLALKNTPLAFLTSYSYERLNPLHQIGGYTTVTYVFLHLTLFSRAFTEIKEPSILLEDDQIHGIIAGSGMFVTLIAAVVIRRLRYELFYVTHVLMYMLIIINVGLHRPNFALKAIIITCCAGGVWACDRLLRGARVLFYVHGNRATITPLPQGGTRIVLSRCPARAAPGNHCFLWIPQIRLLETHPFTIVSATPSSMEFVVAAYDGFTNDLHRYATAHSGVTLRASVDGPYGTLSNFAEAADKVVLIAGGSGASFTFGVAVDLVKKLGDSTKTTIEFIWAVKDHETLSWFKKEIQELQSSQLVTIHLHTTRSGSPYTTTLEEEESPTSPSGPNAEDEKDPAFFGNEKSLEALGHSGASHDYDLEKGPNKSLATSATSRINPWDSTGSLSISSGRPDIQNLIKQVVANANEDQRIMVAACGPGGLMTDVRKTVAGCVRTTGPSVELHCEQFGW